MIVAAGLSPAWQQILRFDRLRLGEVNRAVETAWCGSGKVLNVGIALAQLGMETLTLAPLGGPALEVIEREFAELGIARHWIHTSEPTRVCTTLLDGATGTTTELVENARPLASQELDEFCRAFAQRAARAELVVLTGSLPKGVPHTVYYDLLGQTAASAVLDIRGPELLALLPRQPLVVKPNREELAATFSRPLAGDRQLIEAMRELNARGAKWVVVTAGRAAVWVSSADQLWQIDPPPVEPVVNPIGCGDCLAAGIAAALGQGQPLPDAILWGMAAAAENVSQLLPARLNPQRVQARAQDLKLRPATTDGRALT